MIQQTLPLLLLVSFGGEGPPPPSHVRTIDLIHFTHTDFGFTDHPAVCRDLSRRYIDVALDAVLAQDDVPDDARLRWTAESTVAVADWWATAGAERRASFLEAVEAGLIDVTALPLNNTPSLDREEWRAMMRWLPADLRDAVTPRTAVQNDVNGFPRAGALEILGGGARYLFSGINADSGGPPLPRPSAFWWKMPDGRRLFVWLSLAYGEGFFFFEREEWRRGPVPSAADTRYRPPRAGEVLRPDDASVRAAHVRCLERISDLERNGYRLPVLVVSMTNMWRYDNDPPFPPLSRFVAAWNRLGLEPRLRLATVTQAMEDLEKAAGPTAPTHEGEWTDWWANGTASAPREVAASRAAKRSLAAARAPVWGPPDAATAERMEDILRDLCLFDEHTWGSSMSVALPWSFDAQAQWNEKARLAWRPMALAEWLLSQRARSFLAPEGEGLWIVNPSRGRFSGWVRFVATCLRDDYRSVADPVIGTRTPIRFEPGVQPFGRPRGPEDFSREDVSATFPDRSPGRFARFWIDRLEPGAIRRLVLRTEPVDEPEPAGGSPTVALDDRGWPSAATWEGMSKPLLVAGTGDVVAVRANAFAPRWALRDIWECQDPERRERLRRETLETSVAKPAGEASLEETPHTLRYEQPIEHPRLAWGSRRLELWKREPRARLTVRWNRISSHDPEILGIVSAVPCDGVLPRMSCGGAPFTPFADQLPGSCRDYHGIDGWARYDTPEGGWLWMSRDIPLVTIDGPHPLARLQSAPARTGRLVAMAYNNFWYTNFVGDSPGVMEFQFDLIWSPALDSDDEADAAAEGLVAEPVLAIHPSAPEDPLILDRLWRP